MWMCRVTEPVLETCFQYWYMQNVEHLDCYGKCFNAHAQANTCVCLWHDLSWMWVGHARRLKKDNLWNRIHCFKSCFSRVCSSNRRFRSNYLCRNLFCVFSTTTLFIFYLNLFSYLLIITLPSILFFLLNHPRIAKTLLWLNLILCHSPKINENSLLFAYHEVNIYFVGVK